MTVTSLPLAMSSRARFQPTLPAPAMTTYTDSHSQGALEHLDGEARRADRVQPLLGVPLGPRRVHHAHDDVRHLIALGRQLRDGEVRVVAVGRGDEHLGLLDARLAQGGDLEAVADGEAPSGVLPRRVHAGVQALVGQRVLVEHGDLVSGGEHRAGDLGADPPSPDDEHERHRVGTLAGVRAPAAVHRRRRRQAQGGASGVSAFAPSPEASAAADAASCGPSTAACPAPSACRSEAGGAVRITWHGALPTTYLVTSPTKLSNGPPRPPSSAPPRILEGSSAASTTACTPRRLASSTIACPARRARTVAVATSTPSYSSPTALARASAARACLSCASGSAASMGSDIGTSKIHRASMVAPLSSKASVSSSAARRPAVWMMSSSSGDPVSGTRIDPYSASWRSPRSAASGTSTRRMTDLPWVVR